MENILFENSFLRDRETAKEIYSYHFFKRKLMKVFFILCGVYAVSFIIGCIVNFENAKDMAFSFFCILFAAVMTIIAYNLQVKQMVARDKEMSHGEGFSVCLTVSDSEVAITTPVGTQSVALSDVKSAVETKGLISLVTKANFMYVLRKDSFTKGSYEEFVAFLGQKGIKIKK